VTIDPIYCFPPVPSETGTWIVASSLYLWS
jgi:hypothetical protein